MLWAQSWALWPYRYGPGDPVPRPAFGGWYLLGLGRQGLGPTWKSTCPIHAPKSGSCPCSQRGYLATASAGEAVLSRERLLALEHPLQGQRLLCRVPPRLAGGNRCVLVPSGSPAQPFPARICQHAERGSQGAIISSKALYTRQQVTLVGSLSPGDWRASHFPSLQIASQSAASFSTPAPSQAAPLWREAGREDAGAEPWPLFPTPPLSASSYHQLQLGATVSM